MILGFVKEFIIWKLIGETVFGHCSVILRISEKNGAINLDKGGELFISVK